MISKTKNSKITPRALNIMRYVLSGIFLLMHIQAIAQVGQKDTTDAKAPTIVTDTSVAMVNFDQADTTTFIRDTVLEKHNDVSPLDIGSNRGIFILSSNRLLQLRILGSVRANFNYDIQDLQNNQTFNPYEIPTNFDLTSPNFFAGLEQTRLAFEVTRRTENSGDIFIRLEGDFKNSSTGFRIRHAYGQIGRILIGQTWSLINNVAYQPAVVSQDGPAGSIGLRTPQIRYSRSLKEKMVWNVAIEYTDPELNVPDSVKANLLKVIPDLSGRFSYLSDLMSFRLAAVFSTISGRVQSGDLVYSYGLVASLSGWMKILKDGRIYLSMTTGNGSAYFMDVFNGKMENVAFNPDSGKFEALRATSGFIAYSHELPANLSTSLSIGVASITNKDFQSQSAYSFSYNALLNIFWVPAEGARIGLEFAYGRRFDKGETRGRANRVSILTYYDF